MSVFGSGIRPWKRQTETKRAADSSVPGKGELVVSDTGKVYAGDGTTQAKNLSPMLRKTDADANYATVGGIADAITNPESAINSAVLDVTGGVVPAGVMPTVNAMTDIAAPRPAGYGGPVMWILPAGTGVPVNVAAGDLYLRATATTQNNWTPASLPDVLAWYDAQAITATDASTISQWSDLSGAARHMVQATTAAQPKFAASAINAHPGVLFDGTDDYLQVGTAFTLPSVVTVYAVVNSTDSTPSGAQTIMDSWASSSNASLRLFLARTGQNQVQMYRSSGFSGASYTAGAHLIKAVFSGATSTVQVDSAAEVSGSTTSLTENGRPLLGARGDLTRFHKGYMGEILIVSGTVSSTNDAKVRSYLNGRWGTA